MTKLCTVYNPTTGSLQMLYHQNTCRDEAYGLLPNVDMKPSLATQQATCSIMDHFKFASSMPVSTRFDAEH